MEMITLILFGFLTGTIFGLALEKSRAFEPGIIMRQLQLKNFILFKVFFSAILTSMVVIVIMNQYFDISLHFKSTHIQANILGGIILGLGIVLSGACPGTLLAQIGAGYKDAIFCFIGGLFGAGTYGLIKESVMNPLYFSKPGVYMQLDDLFDLPYLTLVIIFIFVILFVLFVIEKRRTWQEEVGHKYDGLS